MVASFIFVTIYVFYSMSKIVRPIVYIDENVLSVNSARNMANKAIAAQNELKAELWGLIMATPKDITTNGEDPIENLKERFRDIWDSLWDAFVDDYKYSIIADDAEFEEDSWVKKAWDEEELSLEKLRQEDIERHNFFEKHKDVLNQYNFDDFRIYRAWKEGEIEIGDSFNFSDRKEVLNKLRKKEKEILENALIQIKNTQYGK